MDIVNFPGMIANGQATTDPNKIDPDKDLIVVGKKVSKSREGNQYQEIAVPIDTLMTFAKRPYKVYTALLTQSGTDAPVATVLENTLGEIPILGYSNTGQYYLDAVNPIFLSDKTALSLQPGANVSGEQEEIKRNDDYRILIRIYLYQSNATVRTYTDGFMGNRLIEIRVYN